MRHDDFIAVVEEILEVSPGTVSLSDELEPAGWDSLSNISFIAEADERWSASVDAEQLASAATVADLLALVQGAPTEA